MQDTCNLVAFKPAQSAELETLVELVREYHAYDGISFDRVTARRVLATLVSNPELGTAWIMWDGAAPAGYMVLTYGFSIEHGGRNAYLDEIYIRPAYRGHGIGTEALRVVEEAGRATGAQALHMEVERQNVPAQHFYRASGCSDQDRTIMTKPIAAGSSSRSAA